MPKLNIGLDIDGVINNLDIFHYGYGVPFFKKMHLDKTGILLPDNEIIKDNTGFDIRVIFQCTDKERLAFWKKYLLLYCRRYLPREDASNFTTQLRQEEKKIHIITSRVFTDKKNVVGLLFRHLLLQYLMEFQIEYDTITFCSEHNSLEDKILACQKNEIDIMLEDKRENVLGLSKICDVVCFDASYNRDCNGSNIIRVNNFKEAYDFVNGYKKVKSM